MAETGHLRKRSFQLAGHRTSVALEPEFWAVLEAVATRRSYSLPVAPPQPDVSPLLVALPLGAAAALLAATLSSGNGGGGGVSAPSRTPTDQPGQALAAPGGDRFQHRPEFRLQRHRSAVAGELEAAFPQVAGLSHPRWRRGPPCPPAGPSGRNPAA
jgi:hypothetical protein